VACGNRAPPSKTDGQSFLLITYPTLQLKNTMKSTLFTFAALAFFLVGVTACKKEEDNGLVDPTTGVCPTGPNNYGGFQAPTSKSVVLWRSSAKFNGPYVIDSVYKVKTWEEAGFSGYPTLRKGFTSQPDCSADSTAYISLEKGYEYEYFISTPQETVLRGRIKVDCTSNCQVFEVL